MPVKNKKIESGVKKKQSSKSSHSVTKKIAKVSKASPKKKPLSKVKVPLRKPSTKKLLIKKKKTSAPAPKIVKKVKTVEKIKTSNAKKINSDKKNSVIPVKARVVTSKTTKVIEKMVKKVVKPIKQIISSVKPANPLKKTTVIAKRDMPSKPIVEKPLAAEIVKLVKAVAKKAHTNQASTQRIKRPGAGPSGFLPYETKGDENYMNDAQLAHFQRVLHLWKEQLYADRDATAQHMRDDTINFPDPLDRAALEEEHTLEWRAREREHRLIAKIDQALARIKQGDYGYCDACGAEIGVRRLEARPTATQCIDCKTIDEIRERHTGTVE